jgi:hypothetical protein
MAVSPAKYFGETPFITETGCMRPILVAKVGRSDYPKDEDFLSAIFNQSPWRYSCITNFVHRDDLNKNSGDLYSVIISPEFDLAEFYNSRIVHNSDVLPQLAPLGFYQVNMEWLTMRRVFATADKNAVWGKGKNAVTITTRFKANRLDAEPEFQRVNYRAPLLKHLRENGNYGHLRQFFIDERHRPQKGRESITVNTTLESNLYAQAVEIDPLTREQVGDYIPIRLLRVHKTYDGNRFV